MNAPDHDATVSAIVGAILAADGSGQAGAARDAVMAVAPDHRSRCRLQRELSDATTLRDRSGTLSVRAQLLGRELRTRGFTALTIPRCPRCDRERLLTHTFQSNRVCDTCARILQAGPCSSCGAAEVVGRRRGGEVYCRSCLPVRRNPRRFCTSCGATGVRIVRTTNGATCAGCDVNAFTHCARCDATTKIAKRINGTPVCAPCLRFLRTTPRECPSCREMRLLPYLDNGRDVCPQCADLTSIFSCSDCGSDAVPLPGDTCLDCRYNQCVRKLVSSATGVVHPSLVPLQEYMLRTRERQESTIGWFHRKESAARIIQAMANGEIDITIETLASIPRTPATGYASALLQLSGVIPPTNFERARLEAWETKLFATVDNPAIRRIVTRYASWVVNPRFPDDLAHQTGNQISLQHRSKSELRLIIRFLDMAKARGFDLSTLPQRMLDEFAADLGGTSRGRLATFLSWSRRQNITALALTYRTRSGSAAALADTHWRSTIARLLEDETTPAATRLIGLLAVMFGLPITTSTAVRRDQVLVGENIVRLRLGQDPLNLPPQIADLMRRHLLEVDRRHPTSEWAFPGLHRGRHLEPVGITRRLRRMGIRTAAAQTAAALQLARDIPAPVLADLLGWSVERAEDWASAAAHDWTTYPELRSSAPEVRRETTPR